MGAALLGLQAAIKNQICIIWSVYRELGALVAFRKLGGILKEQHLWGAELLFILQCDSLVIFFFPSKREGYRGKFGKFSLTFPIVVLVVFFENWKHLIMRNLSN